MAVTFYTDEHIHAAVVKQLRARDIEVIRFLDVFDKSTDDGIHLAYATEHGYVVVTWDDDLLRHQTQRWRQNLDAAGVILVKDDSQYKVGHQVKALVAIHESETPESMLNRQLWI